MFAFVFSTVGLRMFQNLSSEGAQFWLFQLGLLIAFLCVCYPWRKWTAPRLALVRLFISATLFVTFFLMASFSDGFRY